MTADESRRRPSPGAGRRPLPSGALPPGARPSGARPSGARPSGARPEPAGPGVPGAAGPEGAVPSGAVPADGSAPQRIRIRRRRTSWRKLRRRRRIGAGLLVVGGLAVLGAAWVLITGLLARGQLDDVQSEIATLRMQIVSGDLGGARATAGEIGAHAGRAADYTSGPAWSVAAAVPAGGTPFAVVRDITRQTQALSRSVLPAVVTATRELDPSTLRSPDGRIDLARIAALGPSLTRADATMGAARASVAAQPATTWLGPVDSARRRLIDGLAALGSSVHSADLAVHTVPAMLGENGTRRYFVAFQNDAEARGTGGLPGAFAIAQVSDGKLGFERFEPDSALFGVSARVRLGAQYDAIWRDSDPYSQYVDSNVSPNFPYAARIWLSMWQAKTGQRLDGAIALDPQALSYLLAVTGPVALPDGVQVNSGNVVALTQKDVYAAYDSRTPAGNQQRKDFLLDVARAVSTKVIASGEDTALVRAAGVAGAQRRLLVYSTDPTLEAKLQQTSLSGAVPDTAAPFAGLVVDNAGGNKLDYYLDRSISWAANDCGDSLSVTVTVRLTNAAPAGLPPYVTERNDHPAFATNPGDNREAVFYYATRGAVIDGLTLDGVRQPFSAGFERGHPVFGLEVELPRGATRTLVYQLTEPASSAAPTVLRQPLVRPLHVSVSAPSCS